jgi:two-component system phosphate regulon sensor histidine kinase PhoR
MFGRVFVGYALLLLLFALAAAWVSSAMLKRQYDYMAARHLQTMGEALGVAVRSQAWQTNAAALNHAMTRLGHTTDMRITIIATNGVVLADSDADARGMENHADRPEVRGALAGAATTEQRFSDTLRQRMLYVAVPVTEHGRVSAVVRVSTPLATQAQLWHDTLMRLAAVTVPLLALACVAAVLLARRIVRPVRDLRAAAQRVAAGDFNVYLEPTGSSDVQDVAASFNSMTQYIRRVVAQLTSRNTELDAVIGAMREALVVLDADDRILLANQSFARISATTPARALHYWECVRAPALQDLVQAARADHARHSGDVPLHDQHYLCNVTPLDGSGELVVTLHDVTELRRVERMRRDFVSNVSHELRTPLTAIKGFVETLEEDAALRDNRYLEIIRRHTDRLIAIVQDLLTLSALEQRGELQCEMTDLRAQVERVVKIFEPRLRAKSLYCIVDATLDLPPAMVDRFKMDQVLVNLLDNAINYTEQGGITVRITGTGERLQLAIQDTGIGIAAEHLPRIFERFYTVDKSRARKYGGTGLGLSIVKHIVLLHHGSIDVTSEVNRGTTFTLTLPLAAPSRAPA